MRALCFGLVAGGTLSALRAPLGLDLLTLPARSAEAAHGYRAIALAVVALGLLAAGRTLDGRSTLARVCAGAALGLGLHALLSGRTPDTPAGALAVALVALGLLLFIGRFAATEPAPAATGSAPAATGPAPAARGPAPAATQPAPGVAPRRQSGPLAGEATGLAIAGAGLALVLEGLARHVRPLGAGLPAEDGLSAAVLLLLLLFGGVAFGRLVPGEGDAAGRSGGPLALCRSAAIALAGAGGLLGLVVVSKLASPAGLHDYLDRFGLDASRVGMAGYVALIAAATLVACALPLGAALFCLVARRQLAALLLGAAAGLVLLPSLLGVEAIYAEIEPGQAGRLAAHSAGLVRSGALVAALGAALCASLAPGARPAWRLAGLATPLLAFAAVHRVEVGAIPIVRPWRAQPQAPLLTLDTPEGLLAIERSPGGLELLTLDGRELTPPTVRGALDRRALELSFALLPVERHAGGELRVLLVGQLTRGRALALSELGATAVDRSASWHRAMPLLEERLFRGEVGIAGRVLAPAQARAELAAGRYDLVLVPAVPGEAPATASLASPPGTLVVVWLDGASDVASKPLGEVLATTDLEGLWVGLSRGPRQRPGALPRGVPVFVPAGARLREPAPHAWLGLMRFQRELLSQRRLGQRLAEARAGADPATRALAEHFAAQRHSSPFETRAQRIELGDAALAAIRDAALAEPQSSLAVDLAEGAAQVLRGKRWADEVRRYLAAPAERHWPWPELERALAYAHIEALEPESADERLSRLVAAGGGDPETLRLLGDARLQGGRPREAADAYGRALDAVPGSRELERRLAMALVHAGDPTGREIVRQLLLEEPQDEELRPYLEDGPPPPVPRGYRPIGGSSAHHHGHDDPHGRDGSH